MSEPKLISPMLDGFVMGDPISDHAGVRCCPAMRQNSDERYIVKIISTPASQKQLDALLLTGAYPDAESARAYFKELTDTVVSEIEVLKKLSEMEGFLSFETHQIVPMENAEIGYDVYVLTQYRRTLARLFKRQPITHLGAINLGLDMCSALSVCRRAGYLFVDLKPSNIHIVNDREYRIGDIGFVRLDSLKYASLPDKYRSEYTAPEIADAFASLNTTIDIYALGLILYQAYNGGILPNTKVANEQRLPPPEYADYEMSEIILKACDPDPAERWQDPMQMGQALVSYMQRNGANDVPIVPPVVPNSTSEMTEPVATDSIPEAEASQGIALPEEDQSGEEISADIEDIMPVAVTAPNDSLDEPEEMRTTSEPEEAVAEASMDEASEATAEDAPADFTENELENLTFFSDDDPIQDLDVSQIEYEEVSQEVSEMMSQVDEIANHEVPEPVVAPEPIDIPTPEPIVLMDEPADEVQATETDEVMVPGVSENTNIDIAEDVEDTEDQIVEDQVDFNDLLEDNEETVSKKLPVLSIIVWALIGAIIAVGAFLFYKFFYLQNIDAMVISGDEKSISVDITTKADEDLLIVICADAYGNKIVKRLTDGQVFFTDLLAGTEYTITVDITGFHKVSGEYRKTYYTPNQTEVVQLSAVTASEDGSALISFTINGSDSDEWTISYYTDGEDPQSVTFEGHTTTLKGLTIGKEYTATLTPKNELYLTGDQIITFTASKLIYPENLAITSFKNNALSVSWIAPEGVNVKNWSVSCYNDSGYSETVITEKTFVTFDSIDNSKDYYVEVSAFGQSVSNRTTVEENSITLDNLKTEKNHLGQISISWDCDAQIPQGGWLVTYTIEDTDVQASFTTEINSAVIKDAIPGYTYQITIAAENGAPVVCAPIIFKMEDAVVFTCSFGGPTITGNDISLSMCKTPAKANWTRADVKKADYTTTFTIGEKVSFVIRAWKLYGITNDEVTVLYVVKDADGQLVSTGYEEFTWKTLWDYYYGELNIPSLPTAVGEYAVTVYFNGGLVGEQSFTVTE